MRLTHIQAPKGEDVDCLVRELAAYHPKRLRQRATLIELQDCSNGDLLTLLSAIEACISENDIRRVRLDLDGETYTLAAQ